jgi:hypothetical protein
MNEVNVVVQRANLSSPGLLPCHYDTELVITRADGSGSRFNASFLSAVDSSS